jgi:hypothetical protein
MKYSNNNENHYANEQWTELRKSYQELVQQILLWKMSAM